MTSAGGSTLYRLFDADGQLLYVGVTDRPVQDRFARHRETKHWWAQVASHTVESHPSHEAALKAEREAIRAESPRYNVRSATSPAIRELQRAKGRVAHEAYVIYKRVLDERLAAGATPDEARRVAADAECAHKAASGLFLSVRRRLGAS